MDVSVSGSRRTHLLWNLVLCSNCSPLIIQQEVRANVTDCFLEINSKIINHYELWYYSHNWECLYTYLYSVYTVLHNWECLYTVPIHMGGSTVSQLFASILCWCMSHEKSFNNHTCQVAPEKAPFKPTKHNTFRFHSSSCSSDDFWAINYHKSLRGYIRAFR